MKKKNLLIGLFVFTMGLPFLSGSIMAQSCPNGMVSYWNLDDQSTSLFVDSYGTHDATSESAVASAAGKIGTAKDLSGTDVITVADHSAFDFAANSNFSVEVWVKYADPAFGNPQVIIGKRDASSSGAYWFLGISNTGQVLFEVQGSEGVYKEIISANSISTNAWHHIVGVREESTNSNKLYVDGVLAASTVYDYTGTFATNGDITIGAFNNASGIPSYFLNGIVDEAAIYNVALSQNDINEHLLKNSNGIGYCDSYSPTIKSSPVNTAIVGQQYAYTVYASGMPTMNYSLVSGPTGMTVDNATGLITWTPASIDDDAFVTVVASNNVAPADTQSFRIFLAEAPVCPSGISVLLKLNETSGSTYYDYYADHNSLATVAPTPTAGIVNGAQMFNANTGIDIPDIENEFEWSQTSDFSFECWVKTSSTNTMVILGRHRKADDFPTAARYWVGLSGGIPTFYLHENDTSATGIEVEIAGTNSIADNLWHHIIAVRQGSIQENRLYVDGVEVASQATTFNNSFIAEVPTEISVGYWKRATEGQNEYHFVGAIDEVAIFNKAISDAEASTFYNAGSPTGHCAIDNYAPVITSTPVEEATEDAAYTYTFTVEDVDATDLITISAPTKPSWLNFTYTAGQKTATLTATPTNDEVGEHNIVLTVSDGTVSKNQEFTLAVANVNDTPEITSTADLDGYVGELYAYIFTATDVDVNDVLTLSAVEKPAWLSFNPANGILTGTPAQADKGQHLVILRVSDGTINVDQTFTIEVDGPSAIQDLESAGIKIFPIPAKNHLDVTFKAPVDKTNLEIVNISGSLVKAVTLSDKESTYRLDLNGIEAGSYYLMIRSKSGNSVGRFVIIK